MATVRKKATTKTEAQEAKREEVKKLLISATAQSLIDMIKEYKEKKERELLQNAVKLKAEEMTDNLQKYKVTLELLDWLQVKIMQGKMAEKSLKEE